LSLTLQTENSQLTWEYGTARVCMALLRADSLCALEIA
jgi:hypothetical protein